MAQMILSIFTLPQNACAQVNKTGLSDYSSNTGGDKKLYMSEWNLKT